VTEKTYVATEQNDMEPMSIEHRSRTTFNISTDTILPAQYSLADECAGAGLSSRLSTEQVWGW